MCQGLRWGWTTTACWARLGDAGHGVLGTVHAARGVDAVPVVFVVDGDVVVIPIDTVKAKAAGGCNGCATWTRRARRAARRPLRRRLVTALVGAGARAGAGDATDRAAARCPRPRVPRVRGRRRRDLGDRAGAGEVTGWTAGPLVRLTPVRSPSCDWASSASTPVRPSGPTTRSRIARLAEELGYDSIWAGEHVVVPSPRVVPSPMEPEDPILDPLVHLGFVAAATERLLLATGIIILPQRNPLVLAKQAATLDVLSGGGSCSASAPATSSPR